MYARVLKSVRVCGKREKGGGGLRCFPSHLLLPRGCLTAYLACSGRPSCFSDLFVFVCSVGWLAVVFFLYVWGFFCTSQSPTPRPRRGRWKQAILANGALVKLRLA